MLNAILAGKAGTIEVPSDKAVSWKALYRAREDLLTATIVERLTYLPASLLFRLLRSASAPDILPPSFGQVTDVSFWPALTRPDKDTSTVEPDVILTFERGALIIEAKNSDQLRHRAEQWAQEWSAYHYALTSGELPEVERDGVFLLALGGIGPDDFSTVRQVTTEAQQILDARWPGVSPQLKAIGCSWAELSKSIRRERKAGAEAWAESGLRIILKDLDEAFNLHGFDRPRWLDELFKFSAIKLDGGADVSLLFGDRQGHEPINSAIPQIDWGALCRLIPIAYDGTDLGRLRNG